MEEYGPTETLNFQRCPTYWKYEKTWEEKKPWEPYKSLGTAMADGLAYYFQHSEEIEKSLNCINRTLEIGFQNQDKWTLEALKELLKKGFMKVTETTGEEILAYEDIKGTEVSIGHARVDLISINEDTDTLIITDHKVSLKLESRYVQDRLSELYYSWQLYDYAWRVHNLYSISNSQIQIRLHLIILSPTVKTFLESKFVTPRELGNWHNGALEHWANMEKYEDMSFNKLPMSWFNCKTKYGQCPAFMACHSLERDETTMNNFYRRKI